MRLYLFCENFFFIDCKIPMLFQHFCIKIFFIYIGLKENHSVPTVTSLDVNNNTRKRKSPAKPITIETR